MAQTIQIKKSHTNVVPPGDLAHGELAYGATTASDGKLSIGRPGTASGSEVNDVIGGRYYTIAIDGATPLSNANSIVKRNASNAFASGKITIESGGLQVDAHPATSTTAGNSNNWNTAYGWGDHGAVGYLQTHQSLTGLLSTSGGTITGNLQINHTSGNTDGNLGVQGTLNVGEHLTLSTSANLRGPNTFIIDPISDTGTRDNTSTGTVEIYGKLNALNGIEGDIYNLNRNAIVLDVGQSGTAAVFTGNVTGDVTGDVSGTAGVATNVTITENASPSNVDQFITLVDSASTGNQNLETQSALKYNSSTQVLTASTLHVANGSITGDSVITIDPSATGITGEVVIQGDLTVKGATTYVESNELKIGDNQVVLNADIGSNNPSQDAGIEIDRGSTSNVQLKWDEQYGTTNAWGAQGQWMITDGTGTNNHYALLATHNAQYETYTIDGGSF